MKDLNTELGKDGSTNRFKFASFNDRIEKVKIDFTAKRVLQDDVSCFFVQGLEKWAQLNCTTDFNRFRSTLPYSTLEQVLFHKEKILASLEEALIPGSLCLEPLSDLVTLLAKDLQGEFDSLVLLERIVLLISLEQDAKTIEYLYNSVAHIFKYQARNLDLGKVYNLFKKQLRDKKEHIRSFAGECLAFLMRRNAGSIEFYEVMIMDLKEGGDIAQENYIQGLTLLFFEIVKQVNNSLHSRSAKVYSKLLSLIVHSDTSCTDVVFLMFKRLNILVAHHCDPSALADVWNILLTQLNTTTDPMHLGKLLEVISVYATVSFGSKIVDRKMLLRAIEAEFPRVVKEGEEYVKRELVKLLCSVVETASLEVALVYSKKILDMMFASSSQNLVHVKSFIEILCMRKWVHFSKLIVPRFLGFIQAHYQSDPDQMLIFMARIFSLFGDMIQGVPKHLLNADGMLCLGITFEGGKRVLLSDIILRDNCIPLVNFDWNNEVKLFKGEEGNDSSVLLRFSAALSSLEFLALEQSSFFNAVEPIFTSLVEEIKGSSDPSLCFLASQILKIVTKCETGLALKLLPTVSELLTSSPADANILVSIADYFTAIKGDESLNAMAMSVIDVLEENISSCSRGVRIHTLRILTCFPEIELADGKPCRIFSQCQEIEESLGDIVSNVRGTNNMVRKLESIQESVPARLRYISIRFLIGLLSCKFMPLVNQVMSTIQNIAQGDIKAFWDVYYKVVDGIVKGKDPVEDLETKAVVKVVKMKKGQGIEVFRDVLLEKLVERQARSYAASEKYWTWIREAFTDSCRPEDTIEYSQYYLMLIRTLSGVPHVIEQRSKYLVPLFVGLFESRITNGDIIVDLEGFEAVPVNAVFSLAEQRIQLLEFLDMLSKVKKLGNLYRSDIVRTILLYQLSNGDSIMQEKTFKCILGFGNKIVVDWRERLEGLLDDEKFRDSLSNLNPVDFEEVKGEGRGMFVAVVTRILYGKTVNRKGRASAKTGLHARRNAIFAFLATIDTDYQSEFFDVMAGSVERGCGMKVQVGFLNVIESFLGQFKVRSGVFMERVLRILFGLIVGVETRLSAASSDAMMIDGEDQDVEMVVEEDPTVQDDDSALKMMKYVRTLAMKRIVQCFGLDIDFNFDASVETLFDVYVNVRIEKLAIENTQASSSLLDLFFVWARRPELVGYLGVKSNLVENILKVMSAKKVKEGVVSRIFDIVEALIGMSEDQSEEESAIVTLLIPNMDCLLEQFRLVLLENSGEANLVITKSIPSRILSILSKLAPWVKTSSHLGGLVDIMVPFLRKPVRQVNEGAKVEILSILGEYLSMFEEGRDIEVYFNTLAGLFSSLESQKARSALVVAFKRFEGIEPKMAPLISALVDLNTYSAKRLDEPDFETKFTAFKLVASDESKFTSREWLPLVHNLLYNLRDEVEYSVRTAGVECLLRIVDLAAAEGGDVKDGALSFLDVSIYTLLPEIKKGLKFNSEVVRKEFVIVLAALIGKLPEHPRLVDMAKLLAGGDDEANFFSNVYHPQIHRRERALRRLSKECEGISSGNLNSVFIPIVSHFVFESSLIERHQLVNEAVNALSACANSLPWGHYYRLICRYFESLKKKPHLEHVVVRVVVAILESFHFKGKEVLVVEEDDFNAMETEETIEKEDVLALKIHSILVNKLIPELHKFLAKKEDESLVVRTPVALAITKLLQRMPLETLQTNLPKLVLTLCNILKSRQQSARDAAREVLVKMLIGLGVGYLGYFVKELYGVLTKGYQLHVLGYAIHSLLVGIAPTIDGQSKEMDGSVYLLVQIFVNDIFGEVGAEREVQELNGKMREIKKTMSFDSFELVASVMGMEKTMMLLNPLKELMLETSDPRVTQKIDTVLRRVAAGLNVNKSVEIRDLMVFIHALVNENLELSKLKEVTQKKGKGHRMLESNFCVTMKRPDATHQPLKHFQANAHRFVEFGYSLLLTSLKRGTLDVKDTAHLAMIEPMVNVLGKSLYSKHTSVLIAVIRIMSYVIKLPLKSVKIALPVIVKRLLEMVSRSSDTGSEIVQNSFRLLANVIRYCPEVEIKEHQLVVILDMIKPDLEDPDRQAVSFSLIRAVLSRKYVVEVVYDVMDLVAKILVTSQGSQVRALSRSAYLQFLTEYPQGEKRMEKQWNHVIMNLRYEHESGRESVMELLNSMFDKFPESVVEEYSEIVFLSLVVGLVNDDSSKCRNMAGLLLKKLFKKNSFEKVKKLLPLVNDWFSKIEKPEMIRTASQVYGLIFEAFDDLLEKGSMKCIGEVMPNIMACLNLVVEEMKAANDVEVVLEDDSVLLRYWDAGYYSLMTLGKIMRHQASFDMCVEWYDELLSILTTLLAHPHQWVRSASSRVFGVLFSRIDGSGLLGEGVLYDLGVKSAVQLQGKHVSLETCTQVVKNLFFIGKTMHANSICDSVVKKDGDGEVEEMTGVKSSSLARLIKKLAYFCRSATKNCEHTRTRLIMPVLSWFAAISSLVLTDGDNAGYLTPIMATLYRCVNDDDVIVKKQYGDKVGDEDEVRTLANEVLDMIKTKIGADVFLESYNSVRAGVLAQRHERKQARSIMAVVDPEAYAKRKVQQNLGKRDKRRKRNEGYGEGRIRGGERIKRRRVEE